MSFSPPFESMQYLMRHAVDLDRILASGDYTDVSDDLIGDILGGAAQFASDIMAPLNRTGDQNPAQIEDGNVIASPGFQELYQSWVEGGWQSLAIGKSHGGMGLPQIVNAAAAEMFYGANMAFGLCPMLTSSAVKAISAHGSDELKSVYLDKMVTGEWSGAMDLTEPQAGSDLGPVRTRAVDNGDGTYALTGQKIYITWGDHDCADNIVHLVLARLPHAPAGSKGISLFLCPKYLVNEDGSPGVRNSFKPIGLEHKLGINGSPTCVMEFDGATGWLVGLENRGLACMFTMMNEARLFVGVQGVAIGERAYQQALQYAHDRVQGRVIDGEAEAPIIGHPDVRRMLLEMKTRLMGARAICMATAAAGDLGDYTREALLTPIAKAYGSDVGVETTSIGVQIHGGMGFVEETGAAQHYRDSRIAPIYEGTNGIQAIDLVVRKLRRDGGEGMRVLVAEIDAVPDSVRAVGTPDMSLQAPALAKGVEVLKTATDIILNASEKDALTGATPYLRLCGDVISGVLLIKSAVNGFRARDPHAPNMLALAAYHTAAILPHAEAQLDLIRAGASAVFDYPVDRLADL